MNGLGKRLYNLKTIDKKLITLFTTLVNFNGIAYYIFLQFCLDSETATSIVFSNQHFILGTILAVFDLLICWGYIHLCIKKNSYIEYNRTAEIQSALETAELLMELNHGNIVSSGIYSFDYVSQIEPEAVKGDEIWCITGDLEEDAKNNSLREIIHENLKKGVVYRYFITRVGETISDSARWGKQKLLQDHAEYKRRLKFIEISEELIAPDIDIIIYKANNIYKRSGFVCVEIGTNQNTYIYQQINQVIMQGICDRLMAYNSVNIWKIRFQTLFQGVYNAVRFFVNILSVPYSVISVLVLLSFSHKEIGSWVSATMFLIPAIIESLITYALVEAIAENNSEYKEALEKTVKNESTLASIVNSSEIQLATDDLKKKALNQVMIQKGLGHVKEIFCIDNSCSTIWILSDLSYDIANQDFYDWLTECMISYDKLKCNILYTTREDTVGRFDKVKRLEAMHQNRVKTFPIDNISAHYIWSKTHGIIYLDNINKEAGVYISLGGSGNTFYKKVDANEEETATLLGRLKNIAGTDV